MNIEDAVESFQHSQLDVIKIPLHGSLHSVKHSTFSVNSFVIIDKSSHEDFSRSQSSESRWVSNFNINHFEVPLWTRMKTEGV